MSILVLGITFKENCTDIRNTRVVDVIHELQEFGCHVDIYDPWADPKEVKEEYNLSLLQESTFDTSKYQAIVLAVAHHQFKDLDLSLNNNCVVYDIKSVLHTSDGKL